MTMMAIIARVLLYSGALIAIGDVVAQWVHGGGWHSRGEAELRPRALAAWLLVLAALLLLFVAQFMALELAPTAADVAMLIRQTTWGHGWLWLSASAFLGVIAAITRAALAVRAILAAIFALSMGGLGHAAADELAPALSRALDLLHVLGIGAWIGGLLCLGRTVHADSWAAFSRVATIAAPVTVFTGVGSAFRRFDVATVPQILASDYGRLLGAKTVLVLLILGIGAWHRRAVLRRGTPSPNSVRLRAAARVLRARRHRRAHRYRAARRVAKQQSRAPT
jgi:putative copper export protein